MALAQNTEAKYIAVKPDFERVIANEHYTPPGTSRRALRGEMAANGGDISQLGVRRLALDARLRMLVPAENRAYFQPGAFDLDEPDVVAARVTLEMPSMTKWYKSIVDAAQAALVPKEDLSEGEVEAIVQKKINEVGPEVRIYCQQLASFVNNHAEGNNALKGVILAAVGDLGVTGADERTVAAGRSNEQVPAITADQVGALSIEHLTTVGEALPASNTTLNKAFSTLMGLKYFEVMPRLAVLYEPFTSAVELARVNKNTSIHEDVVDMTINYEGYVDSLNTASAINNVLTLEVVRIKDLSVEMLPNLTDQEFSAEELAALAASKAGDENVNAAALASANVKVANAAAATDVDWVDLANSGDADAATEDLYEGIGTWSPLVLNEVDYLQLLAKYAIAAPTTRVIQTKNAPMEALADFACTRYTTINHDLIGDSDEVKIYNGQIWGALPVGKAKYLFDALTDDIMGQVQHAIAHISYMKSGHHATANNLGHTMKKVMEAIGQEVEVSDLSERLAYGTYFGSKTADQRAVAIFLRTKYSNNELSFAIGRRITPQGPGTVAMYLLNLVMEQLNNVKFFEFMKREDSYTQFKGLYASYAKQAFLEAPYAAYMYGQSKAESVELKQSVAPMFAYASAIGSAMPRSTIADSVALNRDANAASNNSITARLEVQAFVKAYRQFLRSLVRQRLEIAAGAQGGSRLLEDAEPEE
jgi:hypothetical protein